MRTVSLEKGLEVLFYTDFAFVRKFINNNSPLMYRYISAVPRLMYRDRVSCRLNIREYEHSNEISRT